MNDSDNFIKYGEIAEFRNGLNFSKDSHGTGCQLIGVADFKNNFVPDWDNLEEINPSGVAKEGDFLKKGDLIFVRSNGNKSLVGRSLYIDQSRPVLYSGFCIRARLNTKIFDPLFIAYFSKSDFFKSSIYSSAGTNINNLNQGILSEVKIPRYPMHVQKTITGVLSLIDEKIKLNNLINAELEALAKTLYDYWFVQFDFPDANGKPYKTAGGKMAYNKILKRDIPEGWEVVPLSCVTQVSNQSTTPSDHPEKSFRIFSIPVYDATNSFSFEVGRKIGSNKFTVEESDILVSKLNPWFSRVIYALGEEDLICSTEFVVWRTPSIERKNFLYMVARSPQFIAHCIQSATGTSNSHKRVNPNVMMSFQIPFQSDLANDLGKKLEPIIRKIAINQREIATLAKLRDWLLPMLMSGQVTVRSSIKSEEEVASIKWLKTSQNRLTTAKTS